LELPPTLSCPGVTVEYEVFKALGGLLAVSLSELYLRV